MCRAIFNFFLGIITVVLLVVTITGSVAYFSLTNPDFHKQNILESGFYSFTASRTEQYISSTALPGASNNFTEEILEGTREIIVKEFTADKIQIIAENNINNLSSYFNGRFSNVIVYVPVSRIRSLISEAYEKMKDNLDTILETRPLCTSGQQPGPDIVCVTEEMKEQGSEALLENSVNTIVDSAPLLNSEVDEFSISQLGEALNWSDTDTSQIVADFSKSKEAYDTSRIVVVCIWAINLAFVLLFVLTLPKGFRAKMTKFSFWVALIGLGVFVMGIFTAVVGSAFINEIIISNSSVGDYYIGLDTVMRAFFNISFSKFYQQLLFGGAALLFVGVVIFMLMIFTKRKTVTTVVVEPSAPITI